MVAAVSSGLSFMLSFSARKPSPSPLPSSGNFLGPKMMRAIKKMTSMNADKISIPDRGSLKVGYWGDVTVFDPNTIADKATYDALEATVREATAGNESLAQIKSRVQALGKEGAAVVRKVIELAGRVAGGA